MGQALFPLGRMFITPGAIEVCEAKSLAPDALLLRHVCGDWSDMDEPDQVANAAAIAEGSRVFSAFQLGEHRLFVITESDRASTTILLAEEY